MNEQYQHQQRHQEKERKKETRQYRSRTFAPEQNTRRLCTFCGTEVESDDMFCPECGNALGGIRCPDCGTLSFRNFCSNCNRPLNELAREAVREAMRDPRFQKARQLASDLAALEQRIMDLSRESASEEQTLDTSTSLSAEERAAAASYASLFEGIADLKVPESRPASAPEDTLQRRRQFNVSQNLLRLAVEEYRAKAAELQQQISSMLPDPGMPPEEKRNFFCARKITQIEMHAVAQEWVCNWCGCHHSQPSECMRPELGGEWIMVQRPHPVTKIIFD